MRLAIMKSGKCIKFPKWKENASSRAAHWTYIFHEIIFPFRMELHRIMCVSVRCYCAPPNGVATITFLACLAYPAFFWSTFTSRKNWICKKKKLKNVRNNEERALHKVSATAKKASFGGYSKLILLNGNTARCHYHSQRYISIWLTQSKLKN